MRTDELARDQAATAPILRGRAGARARSHNPSRPLRVMHLLWGLGPYGMENGVINICHGLRPDEFTMSIGVFTPGQSAEARVDRKLVSLHGIPRRHGKDLTVPIRLARLLRRDRVDILHTHNRTTLIDGLIAARLARCPAVIHGEHGSLRGSRRETVLQRWAWPRVDRLVSVSSALADQMSEQVGHKRSAIHVIANGVDTTRFRPSDTAKSQSRVECGFPADGLLLGMVARFVEFKNHAGVLRAVAALNSEKLPVHLVLAGRGPLREAVQAQVRRLNLETRVHLIGEIAQPQRLYPALDVLVSNSLHSEGMSNSVLEAMACAVPVVVTRVAAGPELVDEGEAGVLIEPGDDRQLASALRYLGRNPEARRRFGAAGRQRIAAHYRLDHMVNAYRQLYLELAAEKQLTNPVRAGG